MTVNEILTLAASFGGLAVSILTLGLGWAAYRKFLTQKLAESQLSVVLAFVEAIYQSVFHLSIVTRTSEAIGTTYLHKNLFQLSHGGDKPDKPEYGGLPFFAPSAVLAEFKGWAFITNPLLPNAISRELYGLSKAFYLTMTAPESIERCMILGGDSDDASPFWQQCTEGYTGFIERCSALDVAIKLWLKKHGLDDLNQHVVNTSNFPEYTKKKFYYVDEETYQMYKKIIEENK